MEFRASGDKAASTPIAIFNFCGTAEELGTYLQHGCHIILTGAESVRGAGGRVGG